jgi:hypothetical protein
MCFIRVDYDLIRKHYTRLERLTSENTVAYYEHTVIFFNIGPVL